MNWGAGAVSPFAPNPSLATACQQQPALPFQFLQDLCRSGGQAWPLMGVHGRWCHACTELPRPASITLDPLSKLPCWCMGWEGPHSADGSLRYTEQWSAD